MHVLGVNMDQISLFLSLSLPLSLITECNLPAGETPQSWVITGFKHLLTFPSKMANSGLKGPPTRDLFFDFIQRFCFNNPGAKKSPKMALVFQFLRFSFIFVLKFFSFFVLNLIQQTMEIDDGTTIPKETVL